MRKRYTSFCALILAILLSATACGARQGAGSAAQASTGSRHAANSARNDTKNAPDDTNDAQNSADNAQNGANDARNDTSGTRNNTDGTRNDTGEKSRSASSASERRSAEIFAMDTVMSLTAYGPNAQKALDAGTAEIERLDALFSISSETGDIYRINRDGQGALSADTETLLSRTLELAASTRGLFDPTIEPVMQAWGFPTKKYRVPSAQELDSLLALVDYTKVRPEDGQLTLPEGMQLDLGGIAKGYASSRVMEVFRDTGVSSGIISLGGNVQALGLKPDGSRWRVGIQDPNDQNSTFAVLEIANEAVITSGAYQRYFEKGGKVYHHIIDPRTGYPADSDLVSVTIVSPDGTLADALSTALFVMESDAAATYWRQHRDEFDAVMMDKDGKVYVTAGLADRCTLADGIEMRVVS